jgi:hypothetical protein
MRDNDEEPFGHDRDGRLTFGGVLVVVAIVLVLWSIARNERQSCLAASHGDVAWCDYVDSQER